MIRNFAFAALLSAVPLAACGGSDTPADKLEEAAAQSDPAAAEVLEDAADRIEGTDQAQPVGAPGSPAQEAMQAAGNAQAQTVPQPAQGNGAAAPPGAKPHQAGDPVPPPKVTPEGR